MDNPTIKMFLERKAQLEAELAMINAGLREAGISSVKSISKTEPARQPASSLPTTIPKQILTVLTENPNGLLRDQVMEMVNHQYSRTIDKVGCSSYLSILKKNHEAFFDEDGLWFRKV